MVPKISVVRPDMVIPASNAGHPANNRKSEAGLTKRLLATALKLDPVSEPTVPMVALEIMLCDEVMVAEPPKVPKPMNRLFLTIGEVYAGLKTTRPAGEFNANLIGIFNLASENGSIPHSYEDN